MRLRRQRGYGAAGVDVHGYFSGMRGELPPLPDERADLQAMRRNVGRGLAALSRPDLEQLLAQHWDAPPVLLDMVRAELARRAA